MHLIDAVVRNSLQSSSLSHGLKEAVATSHSHMRRCPDAVSVRLSLSKSINFYVPLLFVFPTKKKQTHLNTLYELSRCLSRNIKEPECTQNSLLNTQFSVLSTQHSALSTHPYCSLPHRNLWCKSRCLASHTVLRSCKMADIQLSNQFKKMVHSF